jgi:uncharacterized Rossmann fold enzyme
MERHTSMTQRLVLVVGADAQTHELLKTALSYSTFCTAPGAAHAWNFPTTECPDIVVTDSAFEGSELVRQLKDPSIHGAVGSASGSTY